MLFIYEATNQEGGTIHGEHEAADRAAVIAFLARQELIPVRIEEAQQPGERSKLLSVALFERVTPMDRVLLFRNLATALKAGLTLLETIDILIVDAQKRTLRGMLLRAKTNLSRGQELSKTFAEYPDTFSPVVVGMVEAGERSGNLDEAFNELAQYLTREYELAQKVKGALTYPAILLIAAGAVVIFMFFFTIPRLEVLFDQINAPLPFITRLFVGLSHLLREHILFDITAVGTVIAANLALRRTRRGRHLALRMVMLIPIAHEVLQKIALVRFTRTLSSALHSGLSITEALSIASRATGNEQYRVVLAEVSSQIQTGLPLSQALANHPKLFPHFLNSLITVGEKTGTTDEILHTFADFYDAEVDHTLKNLTTILEPVLLLGMGVLVATIAVSMLYPIYRFVGSFV